MFSDQPNNPAQPSDTPSETAVDTPTDSPATRRPLVIDLDGTLVATDTLHELLLELVGRGPGKLPRVAGASLRGKAALKAAVGRSVSLDPAALPYRQGVLDLIRQAKDAGRPVVLASASDTTTVHAVAEHLAVFDAVIASDGVMNAKGANKLEAIRALLVERGWGQAFDYAGDDRADLPIWAQCETAYIVGAKRSLADRAASQGDKHVIDERTGSFVPALVRACRPHQWCKNLLLALPMFTGQRLDDAATWGRFALAFVAFGLCASAVYLVNDLLDLRSDRLHPTKRRRPMAAGELPVAIGLIAAPLLVAVAIAGSAWLLPEAFVWALVIYTAVAWLYSFAIKNKAILDVVWLGGLYTLRVIAGGLATLTPVSEWLLGLSLFIFMSIALAKRYAELRVMESEGKSGAAGRNYAVDDQSMLSVLGVSSGMLSVLVLALYINSDKVIRMYEHPQMLWIVCPVMLYWIGRLWLRAHRRLMRDDPLLFALTDRVSYIVAMIVILAAMLAS